MGKRNLEIVLASAEPLTRQYPSSAMVVHATAHITDDSSAPVQEIPPDPVGDVNPRWNQTLGFTLHCSSGGSQSTGYLYIELYNTSTPDGSSCAVGSVQIPLMKFLTSAGEGTGPVLMSWPLSTGGCLYFSYKLEAYISRTAIVGTIAKEATLQATVQSVLGFGLDELIGDDDDEK